MATTDTIEKYITKSAKAQEEKMGTIGLSELTKELIDCRERLGKLYTELWGIFEKDELVSYKNFEKQLEDTYVKFDASLEGILATRISVMMVDSGYTNI